MIDLHYWPTPNGKKVTILLEELGMPYKVMPCNIGKGDQFTKGVPEDRSEQPHAGDRRSCAEGRRRADRRVRIRRHHDVPRREGRPLLSAGRRAAAPRSNQWVIWQMANQGPKTGEFGHFSRLGDTKGDQSYAVRRFADEVNRLYGVMNNRLYDRRYLAGDEYTIADMISYPWTVNWKGQGQNLDDFKYFKRWFEELSRTARRAARHGGHRRRAGGGSGDALRRGEGAPRKTALQPARPTRAGRRPARGLTDSASAVIASEAKQSSLRLRQMPCWIASSP